MSAALLAGLPLEPLDERGFLIPRELRFDWWVEHAFNNIRQQRQQAAWAALGDVSTAVSRAVEPEGHEVDGHRDSVAALCWKGIPDSLRVQVYLALRGEGRKMDGPGEVARLVELAKTEVAAAAAEQIERDLPRTFSQHQTLLAPERAGLEPLRRVLLAAAVHNKVSSLPACSVGIMVAASAASVVAAPCSAADPAPPPSPFLLCPSPFTSRAPSLRLPPFARSSLPETASVRGFARL